MTRKSVKSLQNVLNETQVYLSSILDEDLETISKSAYTQARKNLNYEAFIELSCDIRDKFYEDGDYHTYKGFRLLGVDGSIVTLPSNEEIKKEFSTTNVSNQHKDKDKKIVQARASLLYDLLNSIVVDAQLCDSKTHEIVITKDKHLQHTQKNDLIIFDRGYPSYNMFATITTKYEADYLIRVKKNTYKEHTAALFEKDGAITDIVVTMKASTKTVKNTCIEEKLPLALQVRFVKVVLDNGEIEVLATSVLESERLKTSDFKDLYFQRWKIETCYEIIKNRLSLENFTGTTVLSVKQDFYATIFVSNIEALVVSDLDEELKNQAETKELKYQQKVSKSVSFNTIKNYAFRLFYSNEDTAEILEEIYQLLKTNKLAIRPNRQYKRPTPKESKHTKSMKSAHYQKREKKIVF